MLVNSSMRFHSKRGYLIAVICLALMVVALGAAAKHSQFESPLHSTHYLKQSVKMVASNDHPAVGPLLEATPMMLSEVAFVPLAVVPLAVPPYSSVPSPLLV